MRLGPETLFVFLAVAAVGSASPSPQGRAPQPSPSPSPRPSPSPTPTPRFKLVPYGFETPQERSVVPLLRFEDKAEVRSLEMNAAIARFFERSDDKGNMLRGATPGGAPTLSGMAPYRPHATQGMNLLGGAILAAKEIKKQIDNHTGLPGVDPSPSPSLAPGPTPSPRGTPRG